jgi:hypothetical protein
VNWEEIGAIGQMLGSIAVFVTLGFLVIQIRQNTRAMRASSQQTLIDTFYEYVWQLGENAELGSLVGRGLSDFRSLSDEEKSRFNNLYGRWEGNLYNGILLHRSGLLDEQTLNEIGDRFVSSVQTSGGAAWFAASYRNPVVDAYVRQRLSDGPTVPKLSDAFPYWIKGSVGGTSA